MTWVLEEPIYIVILGVVTLLFLGFALLQTGYRFLIHAMLAVAAITVGLLLLENAVVTEKENVEATLDTMAQDVKANDLEAIYAHVYSGAPEILARAKSEFPRYTFNDVKIKDNVEVEFQKGLPRKAKVTFNVLVDVDHESIHFSRVPSFVTLTLVFENGQWRVSQYSHDERTVFGKH